MKIRRMRLDDIDAVAALEERSFEQPWSREMFYRDFTGNSRSRFYVAELHGRIVGYLGVWVQEYDIHITTIAVEEDYRRQGIATRLIRRLIGDQAGDGKDVTLEVRVSNRSAQALYEKLDFEITGRRRDYYSNNQEDALVMTYSAHSLEDSNRGRTRGT